MSYVDNADILTARKIKYKFPRAAIQVTAAQARELADRTAQDWVDQVYPLIRQAALQGLFKLELTGDFWEQRSADPHVFQEAKQLLEADGYKVSCDHDHRGEQTHDWSRRYTRVEW